MPYYIGTNPYTEMIDICRNQIKKLDGDFTTEQRLELFEEDIRTTLSCHIRVLSKEITENLQRPELIVPATGKLKGWPIFKVWREGLSHYLELGQVLFGIELGIGRKGWGLWEKLRAERYGLLWEYIDELRERVDSVLDLQNVSLKFLDKLYRELCALDKLGRARGVDGLALTMSRFRDIRYQAEFGEEEEEEKAHSEGGANGSDDDDANQDEEEVDSEEEQDDGMVLPCGAVCTVKKLRELGLDSSMIIDTATGGEADDEEEKEEAVDPDRKVEEQGGSKRRNRVFLERSAKKVKTM